MCPGMSDEQELTGNEVHRTGLQVRSWKSAQYGVTQQLRFMCVSVTPRTPATTTRLIDVVHRMLTDDSSAAVFTLGDVLGTMDGGGATSSHLKGKKKNH